jgi:hypothetical protein
MARFVFNDKQIPRFAPDDKFKDVLACGFCTGVHNFAQRFGENPIDSAREKNYFGARLNRKA